MPDSNQQRRVAELLKKIQERNEKDPDHGEQILYPCGDHEHLIQMLDDKYARPLSPMLRARFAFVARWVNAHLDQDWLGLEDIKNFKSDSVLMEWVDLRIENWEKFPPASVPKSRVAIFGYNPYEPEETYLVWPEEGDSEPEVWRYFGADYKLFNNLESFLAYVAGEKRHDDSGRS